MNRAQPPPTTKTYALLNLGRDKDPDTSTRRIDRDILTKVRNNVPDRRAVIFFCEINEGDDNNELALIREMFGADFRIYGAETREPIAVSRDIEKGIERVRWIAGTGVPKWSPKRSLLTVDLGDEVLIGCHRAAGANGQGSRPAWARPLLQFSWNRTARVQARVQKCLHAKARHVTWMQDVNHYNLPLVGIGDDREQTIVHRATDWGRVWAADGSRARFEALPVVDIGLDSHDLLRMRGGYQEGIGR